MPLVPLHNRRLPAARCSRPCQDLSPPVPRPLFSHVCRYNHSIVPGRTIVVGTEQGLYARAAALAAPVLRLRSTIDDGSCLEQEFPLDADLLAKVGLGL